VQFVQSLALDEFNLSILEEIVLTTYRINNWLAGALVGALSFSCAAMADNYGPHTLTVNFGDLDAAHPQGASVLYQRIRAAAQSVCSPFEGGSLNDKARLKDCVDASIADAVFRVNEPALTEVYVEKTGRVAPVRVASLQSR
jgi:UrcA family protein